MGDSTTTPFSAVGRLLPAGTLVAIVISIAALVGWFRLENRIDVRIEEKLQPLRNDISRMEAQRIADMAALQNTLTEVRQNMVSVRESLARMEGRMGIPVEREGGK